MGRATNRNENQPLKTVPREVSGKPSFCFDFPQDILCMFCECYGHRPVTCGNILGVGKFITEDPNLFEEIVALCFRGKACCASQLVRFAKQTGLITELQTVREIDVFVMPLAIQKRIDSH